MTRWLRVCLVLLCKELRLEFRGRELITLLVCQGVLLAALIGAGVSSAILDAPTTTKIFPMLLWLVFLFSATGSMVRSNEYELEGRGFEGLLLAGVSGAQMYVAKVAVASVLFFFNFLLLVALVSVALDQDISGIFIALGGVGALSSASLGSLLVVLSAIASTARLRGVLLPLISLPLLFPLYFIGVEMTTELVVRGVLDLAGIWPTLLVCATATYFLIGINLFEEACRE
jgi:ABC-type transport system involved in cytochrome c biogenesis permease component